MRKKLGIDVGCLEEEYCEVLSKENELVVICGGRPWAMFQELDGRQVMAFLVAL